MSKEHYFVIFGVENEDKSIKWDIDIASFFLNNGTLWNDDAERWEVLNEDEDLERDARIVKDLIHRLFPEESSETQSEETTVDA